MNKGLQAVAVNRVSLLKGSKETGLNFQLVWPVTTWAISSSSTDLRYPRDLSLTENIKEDKALGYRSLSDQRRPCVYLFPAHLHSCEKVKSPVSSPRRKPNREEGKAHSAIGQQNPVGWVGLEVGASVRRDGWVEEDNAPWADQAKSAAAGMWLWIWHGTLAGWSCCKEDMVGLFRNTIQPWLCFCGLIHS